MTTPERLRRRQRIEGTALLILGVFTIFLAIYFNAQDREQRECFRQAIQEQSERNAPRAEAVEMESATFRAIFDRAFDGVGPREAKRLEARFDRRLAKVDQLREENPVRPLEEDFCDG